jgi:hypothetical protein
MAGTVGMVHRVAGVSLCHDPGKLGQISTVICSNLRPDRQSGKSGGDPDARAHEIRKRRQEARILARQEVP